MKVLVLGGTADARKVVEAVYAAGLYSRDLNANTDGGAVNSLIYSVAGLVRTPNVPCTVVSGGFSQFGGLAVYIEAQNIGAIMDITHPFAANMSETAASVSKSLGLAYARFERPEWQQKQGDDWQLFKSWSDTDAGNVTESAIGGLTRAATGITTGIAAMLMGDPEACQSVLITVGQLQQHELDDLVQILSDDQGSIKSRRMVFRTAVEPRVTLPECVEWIQAIGPFAYDDELTLMQSLGTDLLISKNSGGKATQAKLDVARDLGIRVMMIQRPTLPVADLSLDSISRCVKQLAVWFGGDDFRANGFEADGFGADSCRTNSAEVDLKQTPKHVRNFSSRQALGKK